MYHSDGSRTVHVPSPKKKICWRAIHIFLASFLTVYAYKIHSTGARKIAIFRTKNPRIARTHSIGFDDDDDDDDVDVT